MDEYCNFKTAAGYCSIAGTQADLSGEIIKSAPEVKRGLFKVVLTEAQKETFEELEATKSKKLFERQEEFLERKLNTISLNKATLLFLQRHEILPDETFSEVVNTARAELEKQLKA